jgi:hypothetical protein
LTTKNTKVSQRARMKESQSVATLGTRKADGVLKWERPAEWAGRGIWRINTKGPPVRQALFPTYLNTV